MSSAFLKGMQEANKFLPSQDKLVIDLEASSGQFFKGVEEGNKFLPREDKLVVGFNGHAAPASAPAVLSVKKEEVVDAVSANSGGGRGRKNPYHDDELEQEGGRSSKQSALGDDVSAREMFDRMLMPSDEMCIVQMQNLRIAMQEAVAKNDGGGGKGANGKGRGRRGGSDVVDLRTLLIHCAQAVATDDRRSATELLKQIKLHARPDGDGTQRLAHCFAEGLQARLAGTGGLVHQSLMATRISAVDMLKAYQLYMAAICFKKVSFLFSNSTIYNASLGKKKIHIIDYGIQYGFQWPCFLRRISTRPGGPPDVRITGIDLPQPGFRPRERIEETGRRLKKYANEFNVPFEYRAIATAKMESLRKEDLKIDPDEVLIVNSLFQFKNLMDESVVLESPRDVVLKNIRKMRPHTFIHAIVNGSFSAPFFVTRFREVLFYYSALFDVLDTTTPRDNEQRMLIEQNILGRAALNVIACEGTDRVERPETYKQWQLSYSRRVMGSQLGYPENVSGDTSQMNRHWMYADRRSSDYIEGLHNFLKVAEANKKNGFMYCPCTVCENTKDYSSSRTLHLHLLEKGFMPHYNVWTKHRERGIMMEDNEEEEDDANYPMFPEYGDTATRESEDQEASDVRDDDLRRFIADAQRECESEREKLKFGRMLEDHKKGYTQIAKMTTQSSGFGSLLKIMKKKLPKDNELPDSTHEAKKVLCPLGLEVQKIHACPNDCILYRDEYENLNIRQDDPGDVEGERPRKRVPAKVMWYAPIIPQLKRLFRNKEHSKLMRWHKEDRKKDGKLRAPADGSQ
ncbi:hypothetical protein TRIUR3_22881 [Triticum urartu]|uniref:Transposase-associated domain-containing protein n=1 Tax=Triticum urartu TaxID=4572 RepID=M7Z3U0_TRIUA|nr:hypothetical protein TRIUR3_22881 [Triticum urartu]